MKTTYSIDGRPCTAEEATARMLEEVRDGHRMEILHVGFDHPWWCFWRWPKRLWIHYRLRRAVQRFNEVAQSCQDDT